MFQSEFICNSDMLVISMLVGEGRKLEDELNKTGPGEAFYIKCDVSKEDEIKVCNRFSVSLFFITPYNNT